MDNKYAVEPLGPESLLIHRSPAHPLSQEDAFNLAAWLVAYGKRLHGGSSFQATLKRVERKLNGE